MGSSMEWVYLVGFVVMLLCDVRLARMAFHSGRCDGHALVSGFWQTFGTFYGIFILMSLASPRLDAASFIGGLIGFAVWTLPVAGVAWIIGRCLRKPAFRMDRNESAYLPNAGHVSEPLLFPELMDIMRGGTL
jgi:hypothetical protein